MVQLVGPTSNENTTFITHSILYYYFMFNIWFQQTSDRFILIDWLMDWLLLNVQQAVFQPLVYWLREQDQQ
jgi:hypothetical protein